MGLIINENKTKYMVITRDNQLDYKREDGKLLFWKSEKSMVLSKMWFIWF